MAEQVGVDQAGREDPARGVQEPALPAAKVNEFVRLLGRMPVCACAQAKAGAEIAEIVAEFRAGGSVGDAQASVVEARIPPAEPRREHTGASQFAEVFVAEAAEIPRTNAVEAIVFNLNVSFDSHEMIDRGFSGVIKILRNERLA